MYRVFCESYENYISQNNGSDYRSEMAKPLSLIVDVEKFEQEKAQNTLQYKKMSDLLFYMETHKNDYPRFVTFLWTIESRGMVPKFFGVALEQDLKEQAKLINMFLKLAYWSVA